MIYSAVVDWIILMNGKINAHMNRKPVPNFARNFQEVAAADIWK